MGDQEDVYRFRGKTDIFTNKCPFNKRQILIEWNKENTKCFGAAEEAITSCQGARKGLRVWPFQWNFLRLVSISLQVRKKRGQGLLAAKLRRW